jgi:hypothetical protein
MTSPYSKIVQGPLNTFVHTGCRIGSVLDEKQKRFWLRTLPQNVILLMGSAQYWPHLLYMQLIELVTPKQFTLDNHWLVKWIFVQEAVELMKCVPPSKSSLVAYLEFKSHTQYSCSQRHTEMDMVDVKVMRILQLVSKPRWVISFTLRRFTLLRQVLRIGWAAEKRSLFLGGNRT